MFAENQQAQLAQRIIETTGTNLFLTGRAGTGKTTFLRKLQSKSPKRMVVLAPTGIAAINARGVTIHSFFQLPFSPYVPGAKLQGETHRKLRKTKLKLIRSLDLLVIDEISMVRADLLDAVDALLRDVRRSSLPFGGVQLLLIGDLQQLAPVVREEEWNLLRPYYSTPYFFSSRALQNSHCVTVELEHVYRQTDTSFLNLLNAIREGVADASVLEKINNRYIPADRLTAEHDHYIRLVTHNQQAHDINESKLANIEAPEFVYHAVIQQNFPESSAPTDTVLRLKKGAQIMFVRNAADKSYFNGMIGTICEISDKGFKVKPNDNTEKVIDVGRESWENISYTIDKSTQAIVPKVEGVFMQYPVKLAWAITIHKSQGLTFDHVIINASGAFAHGQTYVALSRCRTLEGIVLTSPITSEAIISDNQVANYNREARSRHLTTADVHQMENMYTRQLLGEVFGFESERIKLAYLLRIFEEKLYDVFPETLQMYQTCLRQCDLELIGVASRFAAQYRQMLTDTQGDVSDVHIQERFKKAAVYFMDKLKTILDVLRRTKVESDNAQVNTRLQEIYMECIQMCVEHICIMKYVSEQGFDAKEYLKIRALVALGKQSEEAHTTGSSSMPDVGNPSPEDVVNKELYAALVDWRRKKAKELERPAYTIVQTKALIYIANHPKEACANPKQIPHLGSKGLANYGADLFQIIQTYGSSGSLLDHVGNSVQVQVDKVASLHAEPTEDLSKQPKERTDEHSLRLYTEGLSVAQIAQLRSLKEDTVKMHLIKYVEDGRVDITDLMPRVQFQRISQYLQSHPRTHENLTLTELKERIGGDIDFNQLRLVMLLLHW